MIKATGFQPQNERIKHKYFNYLREAKRYSEPSVDAAAMALARFEEYTGYRDFKSFHIDEAVGFKRQFATRTGRAGKRQLAKGTIYGTVMHLKKFFGWLAEQPGYKSKLRRSDAEYFNLSEKDARVATARRERPVPTVEQIHTVLDCMPHDTDIQKRNRALVAFTLLTAARDGAIASAKLKHVDLISGSFYQDAREVKTKFSKSFVTYFFPVGETALQILVDWIRHLREDLLYGHDDPLFPATRTELAGNGRFEPVGLERRHWNQSQPIRLIFRDAFQQAGLPYFNPHSFRKTLVQLAQQMCRTPEQFKAWSQNLGHEDVLTTFTAYGNVPAPRQSELIKQLSISTPSIGTDAEMLAAIAMLIKGRSARA